MTTATLPRFLEKLKQITETTPKKIAGWSKDGKRYEIRDKAFETSVLPKFFDAKQVLLSFSRQLNYYGFKKTDKLQDVKSGSKAGKFVKWAISHPLFQRDAPHLIHKIKRKTRKEKANLASKSEVLEIRKELEHLSGLVNNDLKALKLQIQRLENELATAVDKQNIEPNYQAYTNDTFGIHDLDALLPIHGDAIERTFMKQLSCVTFPETTGLKRKRDQFALAL